MNKKRWGVFLFSMCVLVGAYAAGNSNSAEEGAAPPVSGEKHSGNMPGGGHGPMTPPSEAIKACEGKAEGDACVVEMKGPGQGGNRGQGEGRQSGGSKKCNGVCAYTPDKKYFACKPDRMGPQGKSGAKPGQNNSDGNDNPPPPPEGQE